MSESSGAAKLASGISIVAILTLLLQYQDTIMTYILMACPDPFDPIASAVFKLIIVVVAFFIKSPLSATKDQFYSK